MLARKTCCAELRARIATVLPLRSLIVRMFPLTNSSKQPACTPVSTTIGAPLSMATTSGAAKFMAMSTSPAPIRCAPGKPPVSMPAPTYSTWSKPSARSSSSATYCGARQAEGTLESRMRVVSGGGSAATARVPINPRPSPKAARPFRDCRLEASMITPRESEATFSCERIYPYTASWAIRLKPAHWTLRSGNVKVNVELCPALSSRMAPP